MDELINKKESYTVSNEFLNTNNMRHKFISLPFSRLLKLEIRKVAFDVIKIVEEHNPEELQIKPMYDVFLAEKPKVAALDVPYKSHPATKILVRLRKERNVHVRSIKFELKKAIDLDPTGDDKTVVLLKSELDRFLKDFLESENDLLRNEKLDMLLAKADANEALYEALQSKGFIPILDDLKMNLSDIIAQIDIRRKSKAKRPKVKTEVLRTQVAKAVKNMLDEIYLAQFKNPELDYSSLFNELNEMLGEVRYLVNIRLSNNEKKVAERKAAQENEASNTTSQSNGATTSTPYNMTSFIDEKGMDMDVQHKEMTNENLPTTGDALNVSKTENGRNNMVDTNDATTSNGRFSNKANGASSADINLEALDGADKIDHKS
jgi:hypothetical protein